MQPASRAGTAAFTSFTKYFPPPLRSLERIHEAGGGATGHTHLAPTPKAEARGRDVGRWAPSERGAACRHVSCRHERACGPRETAPCRPWAATCPPRTLRRRTSCPRHWPPVFHRVGGFSSLQIRQRNIHVAYKKSDGHCTATWSMSSPLPEWSHALPRRVSQLGYVFHFHRDIPSDK